MLTVSGLSLELGDRVLFKEVGFSIARGQRVGLVGRNGQGKTTLLKILCGLAEYSSGTIQKAKDFKVAYLPQEVVTPQKASITVYNEAAKAFSGLLQKKERLDAISKKLEDIDGTSSRHQALLTEYDRLHDELDKEGFYAVKSRIEVVLYGLGFSKDALDRAVSSLSGGWIMRLELAKILLSEPDLILLDEPTNHLDLPSLSWLENFLLQQDAGCLIVSHDRTFLDNVVEEIWELEGGRLAMYKGNYSFYEKEREKRAAQLETAWRNQQKKIKEMQGFIERFRAKATKARQVQSRIRQLEKMELHEAPIRRQEYSFSLPTPPRPGKIVLEAKGLSKVYGEKRLFSDLSFMIRRGSKMAVVGPNGAGKSTLLKILSGRLSPDSGQVIFGHNVKVAYFAQHQAMELDHDGTILENLRARCPELSETRLRTIAGIFMFREDDVHKKVSVLSGGEKSRVALAAIMAEGANLLLLDEPTNHLDIEAQEAVRSALANFEGSVVVVSHNRYFLDGFVDGVLEIQDGRVCIFPGNLSQFLAMKDSSLKEATNPSLLSKGHKKLPGSTTTKKKDGEVGARSLSKKEKKRLIAEIRQERSRELGPLRKEANRLENQIDSLEQEREDVEMLLSDASTYSDQKKSAQLNRRYSEIKKELESLYSLWEEASQRLEELHGQFEKRIMEIEAR